MNRVFLSPPPPPLSPLLGFLGRISPTVLLILVILGSFFAISGLLHLLLRYLLRSSAAGQDYLDGATALQGQLRQLFHLHDAGVDQSFIDALPVFLFKDLAAAAEPFDCAVCLCEFQAEEKLRLLPDCSHAFHADCIDAWLLSHSTCPLCRTSLLHRRSCPPFVLLLDSAGQSSAEISEEDPATSSARSAELAAEPPSRVVAIKLGKLKSVEAGGGSRALDGRRCFSMGSFEYVMEEAGLVKVAPKEKKKAAISERESFSRRVFSFRLPRQIGRAGDDGKGCDLERGRAVSRGEETPSFARRTLLWIAGRNRSESTRISPSSCPFPVSDLSRSRRLDP